MRCRNKTAETEREQAKKRKYRHLSQMSTIADSIIISVDQGETPHFPEEGLCIGSLELPNIQFPALIDLLFSKGFCFLYDSKENRETVNCCLERIAWRIALCLPSSICEFIVYNGGNPGENFNTINHIHKSLFKASPKVMFDADSDEFTKQLSSIYRELATRVGIVKDSGKRNLYELNECEGNDARIKYTFIFISDFPHISEEQKKLVFKILSADCSQSGVFAFISWDMNAELDGKQGKSIYFDSLLDSMTLLFPKNNRFYFKNSENDALMNKFVLKLDSDAIDSITQEKWARVLNERVEKASTVSVDIRGKQLSTNTLWSKSGKYGLEIPIGNVSSTTLMNIEFSPSRDQTIVHGLIGGTSGSGKSTLLHDIIINGAWLYSPDELQYILLDFKSVEFGIYSGLPHIRVLSTKSDREYGANVLAYITKEIEHRKKLFGRISSIEEYNNGEHHVPRLLVIIDEFHNLFVNEGDIGDMRDNIITSQINKNLNKILKEGRSFGIHLLLATQEAGSIQSIDSYLQLLKLRIALKMEVKGKFLTFDNPARPDLLKRGEGIYNDDFGKEGSNHPFRFIFYGNENKTHKQVIETEMMEPIRKKSIELYNTYSPCEKCFYRGGGESTIEDNTDVVTTIDNERCLIYVGSPVTVRREDVSFELKRKRGSNILMIGANSDYLNSLIKLTLMQTLRQSNSDSQFMMCISSNDDIDSNGYELGKVSVLKNNDGLTSAIQTLKMNLESRMNGEVSSSNRIVLVLVGLRYFDVISRDTELKNALFDIIMKGPEYGIHVLIHSSRFADYEMAFKQDFSAFGMGPSISPEELLREFDIKIELKSADGYKIFEGTDRYASPKEEFLANIQTCEGGVITKFSIYKQ